jgi:hypothetical protein
MDSGRSRGELRWPPGVVANQKGEPALASVAASHGFVDDRLGFERVLYRLWRRRWHYAEQSRNTGRHFDHFDLRHCNRQQFTANCECSADCGVARAGGAEVVYDESREWPDEFFHECRLLTTNSRPLNNGNCG